MPTPRRLLEEFRRINVALDIILIPSQFYNDPLNDPKDIAEKATEEEN